MIRVADDGWCALESRVGVTVHDTTSALTSNAIDRITPLADAYRVRESDARAAEDLASACGLGNAAAQILLQRGLTSADDAKAFLDPKLGMLSDPSSMVDREAAADRIARAIRAGERIAVFGDYDVDGTTSAALLSDVIRRLGGIVHTFVANRFEGGYGFSDPALDRCLRVEPDLIVTCDVGSSDHPRIERAMSRGIDVIVVDHHLVPDEPLPALAFLNPHRPDCGFAYKGMCSAGLVFSLSAAIRKALGAELDLRPWLDLVALGTVADVAPLDGDNRVLVRAGLRLLTSRKARAGIQALRGVAKLRAGGALGAMEIAFRLAPRLNAPGRLGDPAIVVELLLEQDTRKAARLAAQIEELNDSRKAIERATTEAASAQVLERWGAQPEHGVVVAGTEWHRGVVGISAARLVDRFDVPAIVIALDGEKGHGSARTPDGIHLYDAIASCADHLERFGGHAAAAGVTIDPRRLDAFADAFGRVTPRPEAGTTPPTVDVELDEDSALPTVADLMRLEPMGEANAQPVFALKHLVVEDASVVSDGQHLKLRLRHGRRVITAFGRDMANRVDDVGDRVTAIGYLRPDLWRGGNHLELSLHTLLDET